MTTITLTFHFQPVVYVCMWPVGIAYGKMVSEMDTIETNLTCISN